MPHRGTRNLDPLKLGLCCACRVHPAVGIVLLHVRAPVPGTGWGCLVCHLPSDGAIAVLCEACGDDESVQVRDVVLGYAAGGRREPIEFCTQPFNHDASIDHEAT